MKLFDSFTLLKMECLLPQARLHDQLVIRCREVCGCVGSRLKTKLLILISYFKEQTLIRTGL